MNSKKTKINNLIGGKKRTKEKFSNSFGVKIETIETNFSEEINQPNNIIKETLISKNSIQEKLELKKKYTFSLKPNTIKRLEFLEKLIKKDQKTKRIGGLKSSLIDYIVEEYFEDFIDEVKEGEIKENK